MPISALAKAMGTHVPLLSVSGSRNSSGQLIPAPSRGHIVIVAFQIQNESSSATTIVLRNGSSREIWRVLAQNQGDGAGYDFGENGLHLDDAADVNWTLSGANSCGYNIMYYIET